MGYTQLLTELTADEAMDVFIAARELAHVVDDAIANDGRVDMTEAEEILNYAKRVFKEAEEVHHAAQQAHHADTAADAIRRGAALREQTPYMAEKLNIANLQVVHERPLNVVALNDYREHTDATA